MADLGAVVAESVYCRVSRLIEVHNAEPMAYSQHIAFLPTEIRLVYSTSNYSRPEVYVSGPRMLKDSRFGQRMTKRIFMGDVDQPDWVRVARDSFAPDWTEVGLGGTD